MENYHSRITVIFLSKIERQIIQKDSASIDIKKWAKMAIDRRISIIATFLFLKSKVYMKIFNGGKFKYQKFE